MAPANAKRISRSPLPFPILIFLGIALYAVLLNEEFDSLVKGGSDAGWLLPEEHFHRVIGRHAHEVLLAGGTLTALAVRAIRHPICTRNNKGKARQHLSGTGGSQFLSFPNPEEL